MDPPAIFIIDWINIIEEKSGLPRVISLIEYTTVKYSLPDPKQLEEKSFSNLFQDIDG